MLEQTIRSAAQFLFSINQSRSKVLLDPLYTLAAHGLLWGDIPLSKQLREQTFETYFGLFAPTCERCDKLVVRCACPEFEPHDHPSATTTSTSPTVPGSLRC